MNCSRRHIAALLLHVFVWGGVLAPAAHWTSHGVRDSEVDSAAVEDVRAAHEQQISAGEPRALISDIAATIHESADEACALCALHTTRSLWQPPPAGVAAPPALHARLSIEPPLLVAADFSLFQGRAPPRA